MNRQHGSHNFTSPFHLRVPKQPSSYNVSQAIKVKFVLVSAGGHSEQVISDLIFIDLAPYVILEWEGVPLDSEPKIKVELDPMHLSFTIAPDHIYEYGHPVKDPRPLS